MFCPTRRKALAFMVCITIHDQEELKRYADTLHAGTFRAGDWIVLVLQPLGHYGTMSFANAA